MTFIVELTDAADPRRKTALMEQMESETPLPIPAVNDGIRVNNRNFVVVERQFSYFDDVVHVQVFCEER